VKFDGGSMEELQLFSQSLRVGLKVTEIESLVDVPCELVQVRV
jgi:hypothetical protein